MRFILDGDRGDMYQFSEWVADSVWAGFLVDRDVNSIIAKLDRLADMFEGWEGNMTEAGTGGLDGEKGLFWIQPLTDATEYTIASVDASGGDDGFRGGMRSGRVLTLINLRMRWLLQGLQG